MVIPRTQMTSATLAGYSKTTESSHGQRILLWCKYLETKLDIMSLMLSKRSFIQTRKPLSLLNLGLQLYQVSIMHSLDFKMEKFRSVTKSQSIYQSRIYHSFKLTISSSMTKSIIQSS